MLTNVDSVLRKPAPEMPVLVKVREVAKLLSVSRATVHHLIQDGDLLAADVNPGQRRARKHVRITRASLMLFYRKRFGHPLRQALANPFDA
jgi:excisionase family DNA binding protein